MKIPFLQKIGMKIPFFSHKNVDEESAASGFVFLHFLVILMGIKINFFVLKFYTRIIVASEGMNDFISISFQSSSDALDSFS